MRLAVHSHILLEGYRFKNSYFLAAFAQRSCRQDMCRRILSESSSLKIPEGQSAGSHVARPIVIAATALKEQSAATSSERRSAISGSLALLQWLLHNVLLLGAKCRCRSLFANMLPRLCSGTARLGNSKAAHKSWVFPPSLKRNERTSPVSFSKL